METREQMEARLRMEMEIRKEIEAEQAAEAKKKEKKKTARRYFIGLTVLLTIWMLGVWLLVSIEPVFWDARPFLIYLAIPGLIVVYTFVFFGIDSIFIRF